MGPSQQAQLRKVSRASRICAGSAVACRAAASVPRAGQAARQTESVRGAFAQLYEWKQRCLETPGPRHSEVATWHRSRHSPLWGCCTHAGLPAPLTAWRRRRSVAFFVSLRDETTYTYRPSDAVAGRASHGDDARAGYLPGGRGSWEASPGPLGLHVVQFWSNWADRRTSLPRLGSAILSLPRRRGIVVRS